MDTTTILITSLIILVVGLPIAIYGTKKQHNSAKQSLTKGKSAFNSLTCEILETGKIILKHNSNNASGTLTELYAYSKKKYNVLLNEHLSSKKIYSTKESKSNLGLCGVSKEFFWYNLNKTKYSYSPDSIFNQPDDITSLYGNLEKNFSKGQKFEIINGQVYNYGDMAHKDFNTLRKRLNFYKQIENSGIEYFQSKSIPISDIQFFRIEGTTQYISEITGGGVNMQGAATGAFWLGGVGAIIGSQMGTETKTNIIEKDDRKVSIVYSVNNALKILNIRSNDIDATIEALRQLIPQKEESIVQMKSNTKPETNIDFNMSRGVLNDQQIKTPPISSADEIKKFKELLDIGAITREEFESEKKRLLGKTSNNIIPSGELLTENSTSQITSDEQEKESLVEEINLRLESIELSDEQDLDISDKQAEYIWTMMDHIRSEMLVVDVLEITNSKKMAFGFVSGNISINDMASIIDKKGNSNEFLVLKINKLYEGDVTHAESGDTVALQIPEYIEIDKGDIIVSLS